MLLAELGAFESLGEHLKRVKKKIPWKKWTFKFSTTAKSRFKRSSYMKQQHFNINLNKFDFGRNGVSANRNKEYVDVDNDTLLMVTTSPYIYIYK